MKNWLKNLLFVIFSFVFLGVGMLIANIFIKEKGNPLKDPNFLAETPVVDSTTLKSSLPVDSTDGWLGDTIQVPEPVVKVPSPNISIAEAEVKIEPKKESFVSESKHSGDYDVVIGIFGERSNANKQVKRLKDFGYENAYSYSKLSMDVVSAGQFDKNEAQKIASDLDDKGFDAIVKRR
jgi:cell division septation protein DedD